MFNRLLYLYSLHISNPVLGFPTVYISADDSILDIICNALDVSKNVAKQYISNKNVVLNDVLISNARKLIYDQEDNNDLYSLNGKLHLGLLSIGKKIKILVINKLIVLEECASLAKKD